MASVITREPTDNIIIKHLKTLPEVIDSLAVPATMDWDNLLAYNSKLKEFSKEFAALLVATSAEGSLEQGQALLYATQQLATLSGINPLVTIVYRHLIATLLAEPNINLHPSASQSIVYELTLSSCYDEDVLELLSTYLDKVPNAEPAIFQQITHPQLKQVTDVFKLCTQQKNSAALKLLLARVTSFPQLTVESYKWWSPENEWCLSVSWGSKLITLNDKNNYLLQAVKKGKHALVEELLARGAQVDHADNKNIGTTALILAIEQNDLDMAQLLIAKGASLEKTDALGYTPLMRAAIKGAQELVTLLLKHGAKMEQASRHGTAFILAAKTGKAEIVKLLLENGANINQVDSQGDTALMNAVFANNMAVVTLLLAQGASCQHINPHGNNALMIAAQWSNFAIVQLLLEHQADSTHTNRNGDNAMTLAERFNRQDIAKLLKEHSCNNSRPKMG